MKRYHFFAGPLVPVLILAFPLFLTSGGLDPSWNMDYKTLTAEDLLERIGETYPVLSPMLSTIVLRNRSCMWRTGMEKDVPYLY
jgi:hypothetical protein